jgi:hypothetical protein
MRQYIKNKFCCSILVSCFERNCNQALVILTLIILKTFLMNFVLFDQKLGGEKEIKISFSKKFKKKKRKNALKIENSMQDPSY